jgi:hypothetical protein
MIELEVLDNKIFFRDGIRLAGPLDHVNFHQSLVRIADELQVRPAKILSLYLNNRKKIDAPDDEIDVIHNNSDASITLSDQTQ